MGENFKTTEHSPLSFLLPELSLNKKNSWKFHADERPKSAVNHDMIIGRDLLHELGIILDFSKYVIK